MEIEIKEANLADILTPIEFSAFKILTQAELGGQDAGIVVAELLNRLTDEHNDELFIIMTMLVNKLTNEPYKDNNDVLKTTLETIMQMVSEVREYLDGEH